MSPLGTEKPCLSLSDSSSGWRCSQIIPDGPGTAPRLPLRKFGQKTSSSRSNGLRGIVVNSSGGRGSRGATGRRSGFLNEQPTLRIPMLGVLQTARPGTFVVCSAPSSFTDACRRGCVNCRNRSKNWSGNATSCVRDSARECPRMAQENGSPTTSTI